MMPRSTRRPGPRLAVRCDIEANYAAPLAAKPPRRDGAGALVDGVGERYEVLRTHIKTWSVGSPIQAPLGALQLLFKHQPFDADHESQVTVRCAASEAALVNNREMPDKFAALDTRPTLAGQRLSQG